MCVKIIKEKQDLTYLSWSKIRNSSGTAGSFLKSFYDIDGEKMYYKLSNFDSINGVVGHESVNEIIVDRLLTIFDIEHLEYQLINADIVVDGKTHTTYVCASKDFKKPGEDKIALDAYYEIEKEDDETPLEFCIRRGWGDYIYKMLVADFIVLNRDRHGANIEVLRDTKKKTIRLAPLFDHGLALMFNCLTDKSIENYDVMADKPVQCFVGSYSTFDNLKLIPEDKLIKLPELKDEDKDVLFEDLEDVISEELRDKIWDMICRRCEAYEDFCNKGEK